MHMRRALPSLGAAVSFAWSSKRALAEESYWKPGFVPREPSPPHAPLNHFPGPDEKFAVSPLGYVMKMDSGWLYPPFPDMDSKLRSFRQGARLRGGPSGDIIVASYPKCGTTWTQQILLLLVSGGDKDLIKTWFQSEQAMSPWFEMSWKTAEQANSWNPPAGIGRRILKTHSSALESPWMGNVTPEGIPKGAKIVVPTRNPGDAAVSMYHHTKPKGHLGGFCYVGSMSHFISELFLKGNVESGCIWAWHATWHRAAESLPEDRILFISFEEMKADLPAAIRKIATFCDIPHDDKLVAKVAEASGFKSMKAQFEKQNEERRKKGLHVKEDHIRKGTAGGWTKEVTPEIANLIRETHDERLREVRLPVDFFAPL